MACDFEILSESDLGSVMVCDCNTVTINYGNASFRIPEYDYDTFVDMLGEAFAKLAEKSYADAGRKKTISSG